MMIFLNERFILVDENLYIYNLSEVKHYSNLKRNSIEVL